MKWDQNNKFLLTYLKESKYITEEWFADNEETIRRLFDKHRPDCQLLTVEQLPAYNPE